MSEESVRQQPYRVLARKYRPQVFDDLIGQEPMVRTLSNAFRLNRIAQAYMLTGVRGVGKTTTARILARALNYETEEVSQPQIDLKQEGRHCRAIVEGRHMDVIEMDAASHTGIDDIRDLIESAQYRPTQARYKVYIIDEVHMLSKSAFNGLLKTLEEPPEHLKFIFATTEIRKVPVTVLSRCQRFDLRRIEAGTLSAHLASVCEQEDVKAEPDALAMVARAAEGSVRDALSILDQAIAHGLGEGGDGVSLNSEMMRDMLGLSDRARIVDLFEHLMKGDVAAALAELKSQYDTGAEPSVVLTDLADFIHLVTRLKYVPETGQDNALSEVERVRGKEFAEKLSVRILGRAWQMLLKGLAEVNAAERPLVVAEMVLVRMAHASSLPTPDELLKELGSGDQGNGATQSSGGTHSPVQSGMSAAIAPDAGPSGGAPTGTGSSPPTMQAASSGGNVVAMRKPQPQADPADTTRGEAPVGRSLNSFDELIFLVEDKRDLAMKQVIKRHVRLVSFADGRMEMNLVENPPRDFLARLSARLEEWTGKRWMLSVSSEEGQPTLAEVEAAEAAAQMDTARNDPAVDEILALFPGSRIVDIRIRQDDMEPVAPVADESDDNLDGFFE
ncbi:MAG: DNA polymerase III subunit gamma/tau [Rhizobiaceae bacterium]|nr:DNA polymerase III subunit gamma/tau [Rhizobiaceae bacterium]